MPYNVYQDNDLIKEGIEGKEYTVEGLKPNTEYSFSVTEVNGNKESNESEAIKVTTKYSDVVSVAVSPKTNNLEVDATRQLNATIEPSTAKQDVTWSSSADAIATVDTTGKVTAVSAGEATITAKAGGKSGTATVTVTEVEE